MPTTLTAIAARLEMNVHLTLRRTRSLRSSRAAAAGQETRDVLAKSERAGVGANTTATTSLALGVGISRGGGAGGGAHDGDARGKGDTGRDGDAAGERDGDCRGHREGGGEDGDERGLHFDGWGWWFVGLISECG